MKKDFPVLFVSSWLWRGAAWSCLRAPGVALFLAPSFVLATARVWSGLGTDWNDAVSWTNGIPVNGDSVVFNSVGAAAPVGSYPFYDLSLADLTYEAGAPSYTFHVGASRYLSFTGYGIRNLSGVQQTIINEGTASAGTFFYNSATAGSVYLENLNGGSTGFYNNTTAGSSHIDNRASDGYSSAYTVFWDSSTAGSSTIVNAPAADPYWNRGLTQFQDKSSAGTSTLINNGGGVVSFYGTSTAANATIISTGGTGINSLVIFNEKSTAGSSTINFAGGKIWFSDTSKSASANVTASNGTEVVFDSGAVVSSATSFTINGTSNLYLSNLTNPVVGSLGGNGRIEFAATSNLTVGALNTDTTISGIFTGGNLIKQGAGTLTLNPTQTYSGNTTVTAGVLAIPSWSALGAGNLVLTSGGTLRYTGVEISTDRILQIGTTSSGGTGRVESSGGGALTFSNLATPVFGTTNQTRTLILDGTNTDANTFGGAIQNNGTAATSLQKTGAGIWIIYGANTFSGAATITGGILKLGSATAIRSAGVAVTVNATAADGSAKFDLNGFDAVVSSLTFGGATAGGNAINAVATGANILTLGGNVTVTATNNPGVASISGQLNLGASTRTFTVGDSTSAASDLEISAVISGNASSGLTKAGAGVLTLTAANIYTGATQITGGRLNVNNTSGSGPGTGNVTVGASGKLGGTGIIAPTGTNSVTVSGTLSPGVSAASMTMMTAATLAADSDAGALHFYLNAGAHLTFNAGSTLELNLVGGGVSDAVQFLSKPSAGAEWLAGSGRVTLALELSGTDPYAQSYTIFDDAIADLTTGLFTVAAITGYDSANYTVLFAQSSNDYVLSFSPVAVPEPAGGALLAVASGAIMLRRRRLVGGRNASNCLF